MGVAFTMFVPLLISMALGVTRAGIEIPRDNCRWLTAPDWNTVLKCDGNEVVVGACSGGGGWGHKDCPGGTVHELHCCAVPEYYYSILSAAFPTLLSAEALVAAWAPLSLWPTPMLRSSELSPKTTILMQVEAEETMTCASLTRPPRTPL